MIAIHDDGKGIPLDRVRSKAVEVGLLHPDLADDLPDMEVAALIFHPGLSTANQVSNISGRGVGMDAVKATIESLGGTVQVTTQAGLGTTIFLEVPITAAVQRVLLAEIGEEVVAVPISRIERIEELPEDGIECSGNESFALIDDEPILVVDLKKELGIKTSLPPKGLVPLILIDFQGQVIGLRVERLAGQQEIYLKPIPNILSGIRSLAGLTVLADGKPVFLLDMNQIM